MQIVFHIGANCTDGERVQRTLLRNADALRPTGVSIPDPNRYRKLVQGAATDLADAGEASAAPSVFRKTLLDQLGVGEGIQRLVLCIPSFLASASWVFARGQFYPRAAPKVAALARLFPDDEVEFFLAMRNPATFIPAVWRQAETGWDDLTRGLDPLAVHWSDLVGRLRDAAPRASLCVWCIEDTTFVWGPLLRRLAGVGLEQAIAGEYDLLAGVMSSEGMQRFLTYVATHPGQSELQVRRVIAAFLDKYAMPDAVVEEVDAPDWDAGLVDEMTRTYDDDVARIARMPGVEFIAP